MASEPTKRRIVLMYTFVNDGHSNETAARASVCAMPIYSDLRPGRAFRKAAHSLAQRFARDARSTDDLDALAAETLQALTRLAVEHGEDRYAARYEKAWRASEEDGG